MKVSDLLPPERVREIAAEEGRHRNLTAAEKAVREDAINTASPELARAVLLWAAKRLAAENDTYCAKRLRKLAQEIEP